MNILYCGDAHMADGLLISTLSLTKHYQAPIHVYVLTANIHTQNRDFQALGQDAVTVVQEQLHDVNPLSSAELIDITDIFTANPPTVNMDTRFTPYCMLRLYSDLVPQLPDRLLYLDTDIVCRESPQHFYDQDLTGTEFVGVLDHYGKWFFHSQLRALDYVNSGMMLMNMPQIRKTQLFVRCRRVCATVKMFMPDQSALNKLADTKRLAPRRFNEQRRLHRNTVFQHFTTSFRFFPWVHTLSVKPWEVDRVHSDLHLHEYDDVLSEYAEIKHIAK
ncbi:glycosyltransferase [Lacticaseibacillus sharpeae]|uniref:Lipopolysaccharide biosynthesis glycosyltransferase n=1 Tax=Lacticaseibacillus sharpeae JCM 1186 = DSM 20505 TaxID=1291052 RepID=A0A0R1ZYT9_9LACO|nr:glycosyltransferase [Lacticaseibacillus sharpeae]KRM56124.1 lipopolysaccharide biosynthesis glycosyltransferase [Lacticaseibacillus sharpeae JCM 1186 = DSM 20505]